MGKLSRYLWSTNVCTQGYPCLHLIIAPLLQQPKCELTPHEHSMYIRFLWAAPNHRPILNLADFFPPR